MLSFLKALKKRLNELNDDSFDIENLETPRVLNL